MAILPTMADEKSELRSKFRNRAAGFALITP